VPRCVDTRKAGADLDTLDRVDAHHGVRDVGIKLVIQGSPQPTGTPLASTIDARAAGIT
jgi:hypothetical protein